MERINNDEALGKAISPTLHLKKDSPPTLIFFGTADRKCIVKDSMGRISVVVDDEPSVRKYISAILKREDFETVEAGDGAHGLRIVQEFGADVALIVMFTAIECIQV